MPLPEMLLLAIAICKLNTDWRPIFIRWPASVSTVWSTILQLRVAWEASTCSCPYFSQVVVQGHSR